MKLPKWVDIVKKSQWDVVKQLTEEKIPYKLVIAWDYRYEGISNDIIDRMNELLGVTPMVLINIDGGTLEYARVNDEVLSIGTLFDDNVCEFDITINDIVNVHVGTASLSKGIIEQPIEKVIDRKLKLKLVRKNDGK